MASEWEDPFQRVFSPHPYCMDDYDQIETCPAPLCDRRRMHQIYNCVIKFGQLCVMKGKNIEGHSLDTLFYFTCKKYMAGQFLAVVQLDTHVENVKYQVVCTYSYCCFLSPASWVFQYTVPEQKFRDHATEILWDAEQKEPNMCYALPRTMERMLKAAFEMYDLELPLYNLLDE